jgi:hypothetical protein
MSTPNPSSDPRPTLEANTESNTDVTQKKKFLSPIVGALSRSLAPVVNTWARLPKPKGQTLVWLTVLTTSAVTGAVAFQWLGGLPPTPNCGKIFKATLSDAGELYCADQAARKGDEASLSAALKLANSIGPEHPLFEQSQQLSDRWSQAILVVARRKVESGDLKKGVALAQSVPKTSKVHDEAQAMIKDWQENWQKGEEIFRQAKAAIQDQDWGKATEQISNLTQLGSNYWQRQADKIVAEMSIEQQEFIKISAAQDLVSYGTPEDIAKAIQTVSQIDAKRLARKRVAEKIDEWSQKLIDFAREFEAQGDYPRMLKVAQMVPPNSKMAATAAAYVQLGRAETVEQEDTLWSAIQAHGLASQIDAKTPVYEASQAQRQKWQDNIQNWGQLELAKWFARVDQVSGYKTAVDQAALVSTEQPRRVEAQTLIAFWNKQVETLPDRQFIARAKQMAVDNTIGNLQLAITEASKVLSGQPLRDVAQTLIAEWGDAVERVQDKPILDAAIALAKKGDLNSAIQAAEKIESDRALYGEAQSSIGQWVAQIQSVEDRPILNEAEAMAREGRLSEAISRASDIGSSRAMYDEAQSRIADWAEQRRQIEAANQPPPPQETYQEPSDQDETASGDESAPLLDEPAPPPEESAPPAAVDEGAPPVDESGAPAEGESGSNPNF